MPRHMKLSGFDKVSRKLKELQKPRTVKKIAQHATAVMARMVADEAISRVYTASEPWTVYYGSKGNRQKYVFEAGKVADAVIIKRLPNNELKGDLAAYIVTLRKSGEWAPVSRAALMMEYGASSHSGMKPFMRPALEAKLAEAMQESQRILEYRVNQIWNQT